MKLDTIQNNKRIRYWGIYIGGGIALLIAIQIAASVESLFGVICFTIAIFWWTMAHIQSGDHKTPITPLK